MRRRRMRTKLGQARCSDSQRRHHKRCDAEVLINARTLLGTVISAVKTTYAYGQSITQSFFIRDAITDLLTYAHVFDRAC